jgi:hypothetical protein
MTISVGLDGRYSGFPSLRKLGASKFYAARLGTRERVTRPCGNHHALLLRERGEQVQDERINVCAKLGDNELHALCHEPRDEMDIATKTVELRHRDGAATATSFCECSGELRAPVDRISALAGLNLNELASDAEAFGSREACERVPLCLKAET